MNTTRKLPLYIGLAGTMLVMLSVGFLFPSLGQVQAFMVAHATVGEQGSGAYAQSLIMGTGHGAKAPRLTKVMAPKKAHTKAPKHKPTVTPVPKPAPKPKHKPKKKPQPTPTPVPTTQVTTTFPACYSAPGWFYGQHPADFEYGTDFDCGQDTPAPALWPGVVIGAYKTCWNTDCSLTSGGVVIIKATVPGIGVHATYYLHLDSLTVQQGQYVNKGQVVGYTGGQLEGGNWPTSPQYSSGPHIEIGFDAPFLTVIGTNLDPLPYIQQAME